MMWTSGGGGYFPCRILPRWRSIRTWGVRIPCNYGQGPVLFRCLRTMKNAGWDEGLCYPSEYQEDDGGD